jgi:hypothetical protein
MNALVFLQAGRFTRFTCGHQLECLNSENDFVVIELMEWLGNRPVIQYFVALMTCQLTPLSLLQGKVRRPFER